MTTQTMDKPAEPKDVLEMCRLAHEQKRVQERPSAPKESPSGHDGKKKGEFIG